VDPADPERVLSEFAKVASSKGSTIPRLQAPPKLHSVLTTHKHADHSGGNQELASRFPGLHIVVSDSDRSAAATMFVKGGDVIRLGNTVITVLFTPCHTAVRLSCPVPTSVRSLCKCVITLVRATCRIT
jgi:L-ascorbate metabolism protein UlaG (beta-lactamase superfamily)